MCHHHDARAFEDLAEFLDHFLFSGLYPQVYSSLGAQITWTSPAQVYRIAPAVFGPFRQRNQDRQALERYEPSVV